MRQKNKILTLCTFFLLLTTLIFAESFETQDPLNPSMTDNSYSLAIADLINEKCNGCENTIILGDDYVVPFTRINPTLEQDYFNIWGIINWGTYETNIYSDSYYIKRAFDKTFADLDNILSKKVN